MLRQWRNSSCSKFVTQLFLNSMVFYPIFTLDHLLSGYFWGCVSSYKYLLSLRHSWRILPKKIDGLLRATYCKKSWTTKLAFPLHHVILILYPTQNCWHSIFLYNSAVNQSIFNFHMRILNYFSRRSDCRNPRKDRLLSLDAVTFQS